VNARVRAFAGVGEGFGDRSAPTEASENLIILNLNLLLLIWDILDLLRFHGVHFVG
jgi:hypothetical protein